MRAKVAELGWLPDPTGRYEYRYWDGVDWCDDVFDDGLMFRDPMSVGVLPPPTERSRRWAPRFALLGAGALLAAGAATAAALVVVPRDGDRTETAGQRQDQATTTSPPSTPSTTAAPAGPAGAAGRPGPAAGGALPGSASSSTTATSTATTAPAGEAPAGGDTAALIDGLAQGFIEIGGGMLTDEQARCFAESVVEALGEERVRELGLHSGGVAAMSAAFGQMTPEESAAMSQLQMTCAMPG